MPILLYGCTTWTLTKRLEKKQDGNYTRMLRAILNKSWQQHPTRPQLYGHLPPLTKTIQVRRTRHAGHCWRSRSSGPHPVSSHSCWMYVRAGRPAFARPYVGVHRSTSLMSSSLLLQQCPAWLVRLTWIVFVMGGKWAYSWCLVECCRQDLFNIARNILV